MRRATARCRASSTGCSATWPRRSRRNATGFPAKCPGATCSTRTPRLRSRASWCLPSRASTTRPWRLPARRSRPCALRPCRLDIDPAHGLQLHLTGGAVLEDEELQSAGAGALIASVLSTAAVALLLLWGLRSWRLIVATLVTMVVGLIFTAAFTALAIGRLNLISVTFAVLFVGLGVDFGIHVALRYQEKFRTAATQLQAIERAAQSVFQRAHAHRAVRRSWLSELRADRLSGPRRARHHLGLRHAGGLVHQPHPSAGALVLDAAQGAAGHGHAQPAAADRASRARHPRGGGDCRPCLAAHAARSRVRLQSAQSEGSNVGIGHDVPGLAGPIRRTRRTSSTSWRRAWPRPTESRGISQRTHWSAGP